MIKFIFPDGSYAYQALQSVHSIFRTDPVPEAAAKLMARAANTEGAYSEFEIRGFELVRPGAYYE